MEELSSRLELSWLAEEYLKQLGRVKEIDIGGIFLIDVRLEPEEKKRLFDLATKLKISNDALNLIIRNSSEKYLAPNKRVMAKGVN